MIQSILVLGSGSAALNAAISLKRRLPQRVVKVVRSAEIGVIGVGEGTTPQYPRHLFDYLGISQKGFYEMARPTWKIGTRFLWGPREQFFCPFSAQLDSQWVGLKMPTGFYCEDDFDFADFPAALMAHGKVFGRMENGMPDIQPWHGFHVENRKLVETLEIVARSVGIEFVDAKVTGAERLEDRIAAVYLEDGRKLEADFFIDASGSRGELIGRTFEELFISYDRSLFCDRVIVGGWPRTDEPILPYTTAETMDSGWAWQIEHEHFLNRGYVYSSRFLSDEDAEAEFRRKNPKVSSTRVVKFRSGRYRRAWIQNVVAVGDAFGFVEPLAGTALTTVSAQMETLVHVLLQCRLSPTPTMRRLYNQQVGIRWDDICDFLALHYKVNTRLDTPFWRHCREDTNVSDLQELLDFYAENGPSVFGRHLLPVPDSIFGFEGFLTMLVGNKVPYRAKYTPSAAEREIWRLRRTELSGRAKAGLDVREALAYIRHPGWQWHGDVAQQKAAQAMAGAAQPG